MVGQRQFFGVGKMDEIAIYGIGGVVTTVLVVIGLLTFVIRKINKS